MTSSDEDEDLKKAIELSLQDQKPAFKRHKAGNTRDSNTEVIDLDSEDDLPSASTIISKEAPTPVISSESSVVNKNFLGLDRKAMEQERLARKRKASISPPPLRKNTKLSIDESAAKASLAANQIRSADSVDLPRTKLETRSIKSGTINPSSSSSSSASKPTFLDGAVRKTWASGYDRHEDIKIEEVLERNDLTLAVISSFQWDIDWLFRKLDTKSTPITLIMHAKEESLKRQYEEETCTMPNLRLCFPPMPGPVQCMHSKLMLLGHPTYLRLVVTTANMVSYDWGETGIMENMVFLIDLPRSPPANHSSHQMTPFERELIYFLEAMGLDRKIIQSIPKFDFSRTKDLAFVHSIGGIHVGKDEPWRRTGFCGLGSAIRELNLANEGPLEIDYVTSSMGSLTIEFLMTLYMAAQGDDGTRVYGWRNASSKSKAGKEEQAQNRAIEQKMQQQTHDNFRVYFPTHDTVAASNGGTACGGTICFHGKCYAYPQFPRGVLRDCQSKRPGMLMHNKV
jgi:hypothetical protein